MPFILLLGGARSGKSLLAQEIALRLGRSVCMIATAEARDEEMSERIAHHRSVRPFEWSTVEEPAELTAAIRAATASNFLVIDCLTLWVSNLAERGESREAIITAASEAARGLTERSAGAVVVSNEVGLGIVPANELARSFRDTLGAVNAAFAALAGRTVLLMAGQVVELTPSAEFMEGIQWPASFPNSI